MKILLIDDHALFCEGLKLLLQQLDPNVETIEARDLDTGLLAAAQHADISLVLFDLGLPGPCGTNALTAFRRAHDSLPVVVVSGLSDRQTVLAALECGAMGFIPKSASSRALHAALETVLRGAICLPPTVLDAIDVPATPSHVVKQRLCELALTSRQRQVFKLIIQGRPNKLIARDLGVTESTVKAHVKPILKALNVTSRVGAILAVRRLELSLD